MRWWLRMADGHDARRLDPALRARLGHHLQGFADDINGVRSVVLASVDGFALVPAAGTHGNGERLAAMTSAMLALAAAVGRELALGELEVLMLEAGERQGADAGPACNAGAAAADDRLRRALRDRQGAVECEGMWPQHHGRTQRITSRSAGEHGARQPTGCNMAGLDDTLNALMTIDGAQAVALVDYESGMLLGEAGSGMDMEVAAAGNTEVIRAKMKTAASLNLNDTIEDILISLGKAYHILRPVSRKKGLFLYLVLDRNKSNLALARRKVQDVEAELAL